jgi:hypothetical protein
MAIRSSASGSIRPIGMISGSEGEAGLASVMFLMNSLGGGLSPGPEKTIEMHTVGGEERRTTPGGANTEVSSTCA